MLDAALRYAACSWPVAPAYSIAPRGGCSCGRSDCTPGKHPMTEHGLSDATVDESKIRQWWGRWPDANILIRTGMVGDRCLFVLDIDPRHDGDESLSMLEAKHGPLPVTPRVVTGGGGVHYFFWSKAPVKNTAGKVARGIDTRGIGGYVIAAPSTHESGTPYRWDAGAHPDDVPLAEAPEWLVSLVARHSPPDRPAAAVSFIDGGRNNALASLAGSMRDRGFERAAIEAALLIENDAKCRPPLDPVEVKRISRSISRYEPTASPDGSPKRAQTFADIIAKWKADGPIVKASTGWQSFDDAAGGGLSFGRLVAIVGAPNAGKTAVAAALADRYWRSGYVVGLHAVDEDPDDLTVRFCQMAGFTIEDAESGDGSRLDPIATALEAEGVFLYDSSWTIEEASADLAAHAQRLQRRAVYIVDSLQTTRSEVAGRNDALRVTVGNSVRALKVAAGRYRFLAIGTSEMGRAGYQNEESSKNFNDMAAGKETGDIEYQAKVQIVLRSVRDFPGTIRVTVPKLKRGREVEFFLQLNRSRHSVTERDAPAEVDRESARVMRSRKAASSDAVSLRDIVMREPGIAELALRGEWSRRGLGGNARLMAAKRELGSELETRREGKSVGHYIKPPSSHTGTD